MGRRGLAVWLRGGRRGPRSPTRYPSPIRRVGNRAGSSAVPAVKTGSGGYEPVWPSEFARSGAAALLGSDRAAQLNDRVMPRGATAGALAIAWSRQVLLLSDTLRSLDGKTASEAIAILVRSVSDLTGADTMRDTLVSELQNVPELAVREPGPRHVDVSAILGVRSRGSEDEEESSANAAPARRARSRSSSCETPRHRHYCYGVGCGS